MTASWQKDPQATSYTAGHRKLYNVLTEMGLEIESEVPVGKYTLDCYCPEVAIGFEFDGPHHDTPKQRKHGAERDAWLLEEAGIPVLRVRGMSPLRGKGRANFQRSVEGFIEDFSDSLDERMEKAARWVV